MRRRELTESAFPGILLTCGSFRKTRKDRRKA